MFGVIQWLLITWLILIFYFVCKWLQQLLKIISDYAYFWSQCLKQIKQLLAFRRLMVCRPNVDNIESAMLLLYNDCLSLSFFYIHWIFRRGRQTISHRNVNNCFIYFKHCLLKSSSISIQHINMEGEHNNSANAYFCLFPHDWWCIQKFCLKILFKKFWIIIKYWISINSMY